MNSTSYQIPQEIIDRIKDAANIVDEVSEDITLKKQGVNYVGLCPFHNEKTPSFIVNASKGICKCFSCGAGGDVISYRMKHDGLTFSEAVRYLGKKYNIEVPTVKLTPEQQKHNDDKASAMIVMSAAQDLFRKNLGNVPEAAAYLTHREISNDIAEKYGVGFAYDYNGLSKALLQLGYKQEHIIAAGLAYYDDEKHTLRDSFWQRILFPFYNKMGQVIGYTGRAINDQAAKYKNTNDSILFTKGNNIFGLYQARAEIARQDLVYIVEGQFDVLSMAQHGVANAVGGSGTAFTDAQRKLLHGITSNVVFIYDGDSAGIKAAIKNLQLFVKDEFRVRCILLPNGKDPDDMAKKLGDGLADYLKKQTRPYVNYLSKVLYKDDDDDYQKLDVTKQILSVIALESESVIRLSYMSDLVAPSGLDRQVLEELAGEMKVPAAPDKFENGFFGYEFCKDFIDEEDPVIHLTNKIDRYQKLIGEQQPWMFYHGQPNNTDIQELSQHAETFIIHSPEMVANNRHEGAELLMMKEMFKFGMQISIATEATEYGFVYTYLKFYADLIDEEHPTPEVKNEYLTRCAEMISYSKSSILTVNLPNWANILGLKLTALKDIIKPYVNERKSAAKIEMERNDIYADLLEIDTEKIPSYVEQNDEYKKMLRRYGFYPLLNKEGDPVCYMFKTESNSYRRVADFYIEPLFHVYSQNKEENRRVIKINRLYVNKPTYVEWPSTVFAKLSSLQEMLICEGGYNFENGDARDYAKIWNCISYKFPKCIEMKVYGQQEEGCFIFANGIFHQVDDEWKFEYTDELGLMRDKDKNFYSPGFSIINKDQRKDNDRYEQDRWLVYTETAEKKRTTFEHWASLMNEVYKINDNGKWAILYAIMCAFRSEIYPLNRHFTAIFFIGPTMSGKTQIAVSIRSLFIKPEAPSFNLNSGTDAAFFSILERFRDVPQIFEEYNDEMISDVKFQGLKQTCYDGEGKQKRKAATGNDLETSKVNAPAVILGQEAPQKDDNALSNRVVLCEVPKRESINEEHAKAIFDELKGFEKAGLSYLLLQVLALRPIVRQQFPILLKKCNKELQARVEEGSTRNGDQTRVINTVSFFLTMCKLLEQFAPELALPFTYEEFLELAVVKVRSQVDMLVKTDKLAMFFNTLDFLIDKGILKQGRDFKIERPQTITLKGGITKVLSPADTAVLYMNITNVHKMYMSATSRDERPLSLTTLEVNLNSHPAYLGKVSNTRFKWLEPKEVPIGSTIQSAVPTSATENMAVTKIMERKEKTTSAVVLNYDILKMVMNIDFERDKESNNTDENGNDIF